MRWPSILSNYYHCCYLNSSNWRYFCSVKNALPSLCYEHKVSNGDLQCDKHQLGVLSQLDTLYDNLIPYVNKRQLEYNKSSMKRWRKLFGLSEYDSSKDSQPLGLYIYGGVGCGKTMLMDLFYHSIGITGKRRQHFHSFMVDVHKSIHKIKQTNMELKGSYDPIAPVGEEISQQISLLCLDEFQVTDIADAMILKRLFTTLFRKGVILVASSNRAPDELYKNGLQRANFVPFISTLKKYCNIVHLNSAIDYRQRRGSGDESEHFVTYFVTKDGVVPSTMQRLFKEMSSCEIGLLGSQRISVFGRSICLNRCKGEIVWCSFVDLCQQPLAAVDYMAIAQKFHTIFLVDVPILSLRDRSSLRRFITLIDTLYDHRCRLVLSCDCPLHQLFQSDICVLEESVDDHVLRDDLGLATTDTTISSIFTGEEELFAHERTLSRLTEMQSLSYWLTAKRGTT